MKLIFVILALVISSCKTTSDLPIENRDRRSFDSEDVGRKNPPVSEGYVKLANDLQRASQRYISSGEDTGSPLLQLAENIVKDKKEDIAVGMASDSFDEITQESEKQLIQVDRSNKSGQGSQPTPRGSSNNHTISYVGAGVAALGAVAVVGGCIAKRSGKIKKFGAIKYVGPALIVGGVLAAVLNESLQLTASGRPSARDAYLANLNTIGKRLLKLRKEQNTLALAGMCTPKGAMAQSIRWPVRDDVQFPHSGGYGKTIMHDGKMLTFDKSIARGGQGTIFSGRFGDFGNQKGVVAKVGASDDELAAFLKLRNTHPESVPEIIMHFKDASGQRVVVMEQLHAYQFTHGNFRDSIQDLVNMHALGIRHTDMTPGNLMMSQSGRSKYIDLGDTPMGTDFYSANGFRDTPEVGDVVGLGRTLLQHRHSAIFQELGQSTVERLKKHGEFGKQSAIRDDRILKHGVGGFDVDLQVYYKAYAVEKRLNAALEHARRNDIDTEELATKMFDPRWDQIDEVMQKATPSHADFLNEIEKSLRARGALDPDSALLIRMAHGEFRSADAVLGQIN